MKTTTIVCDGCGATTSEAMRPEGWAHIHIHLYGSNGESKPSGTRDLCARCMLRLLSPVDDETRDERRERPTLPDVEPPSRCPVSHNGVQCGRSYAHLGAHFFGTREEWNQRVQLRCLSRHPEHEGLQCGHSREHPGEHGGWRP